MSVNKVVLSTSLEDVSTIGSDRAFRVRGGSADLVVHILGAEVSDAPSTVRLATLSGASDAVTLKDDTPFIKYEVAAGLLGSGKVSVSGNEAENPAGKLVLSTSLQDATAISAGRRFSVRGGSADLVVHILGAEASDATSAVRIATLTSGSRTEPVPADASPFLKYQIIAGSLDTGKVWVTGPASITSSIITPSVATVADLAALGTGLDDGTVALVEGNRASRWILKTMTAPDEVSGASSTWVNFAPSNDSRVWVRDLVTGAPGANIQADWYIDPTSGSDANNGTTSGTALRTLDEFLARIGLQPIAQFLTVYLLGNLSGRNAIDWNGGQWTIRLNLEGPDSAVAFVGTKRVHQTNTLSAVTAWDDATTTPGEYTITGLPDLTALGHAERWVRVNGGARDGIKARIAKVTAAGKFRANFADQENLVVAEPLAADEIQIYSLTTLGNVKLVLDIRGDGTVYFQDCDLGKTAEDHAVQLVSGNATFIGCTIRGFDVFEGAFATVNACATLDFRTYGQSTVYGSTHFSAGGTALSGRSGGVIRAGSRLYVQGYEVSLGHPAEGPGHLRAAAPIAILDTTTNVGVRMLSGCTLVAEDRLWVKNDAPIGIGFHVYAGATLSYAAATAPTASPAPTTFAKIGGAAKTDLEIPFSGGGGAFVVHQ